MAVRPRSLSSNERAPRDRSVSLSARPNRQHLSAMRVLCVTNMYPRPEARSEGTFVEQQVESLRSSGIEVHVLHLNRRDQGTGVYFSARPALRGAMAGFDADLVHVVYGGIMAYQVTRAVRTKPVVVSFCGSDLLGQPCSGLTRRILSQVGARASCAAAAAAKAIIVKSRGLYEALPARTRGKAHIIPNGVDLDRFRPMDCASARRRLAWSPDEFHVLFAVNNADETKRVELAREAVARLAGLDLPARLHEMRGVPHREVALWLNASHALLLTSAHEGSPNIVKEALACDRPVVSVDVGDVRERLGGVENCEICDASPARLAEALYRVAQLPERRGGRASVSNLSLQRVADRIRAVYEDCCESGTAAAG